jgi:DNA-binding transcriptional LysR family regulator
MARLNLTHFETVCAIARSGTFTAAAMRLNASQPAVTARVRELEESLGFDLFHKRGRRMELTIRGRHLIDRIGPLVGALEQEVMAHAAVDASVGVVRLGIPLVALRWIPAVIAQLKRDMPRVEFELDVDAGMSIMQKLEAGKLDLAITIAPVQDPDLATVALRRERLLWLMSAQVPRMRDGQPLPLAGILDAAPLWVVPRSSSLFPRLVEALRATGAQLQSLNTCANMAGILEMVLQTGGIGLILGALAQAHVEQGTLVPVSEQLAPIDLDVALVYHRDQRQSIVRQVMQRIVEFDAGRTA